MKKTHSKIQNKLTIQQKIDISIKNFGGSINDAFISLAEEHEQLLESVEDIQTIINKFHIKNLNNN